jgi:hypothetical protein
MNVARVVYCNWSLLGLVLSPSAQGSDSWLCVMYLRQLRLSHTFYCKSNKGNVRSLRTVLMNHTMTLRLTYDHTIKKELQMILYALSDTACFALKLVLCLFKVTICLAVCLWLANLIKIKISWHFVVIVFVFNFRFNYDKLISNPHQQNIHNYSLECVGNVQFLKGLGQSFYN